MLNERNKLEEELRFLKESLDIGVITQEEFDIGRKRIDKKLQILQKKDTREKELQESSPEITPEDSITFIPDAEVETKQEPSAEEVDRYDEESVDAQETIPEAIQKQEIKRKRKLILKPALKKESLKENEENPKVKFRDEKPYSYLEEKETLAEGPKKVPKKENHIPIEIEAKEAEKQEEDSLGSPWIIGLVLVLLFGFLGIFFFMNSDRTQEVNAKPPIACTSDLDCVKEGMLGECSNPGLSSSSCSFVSDTEIMLTVITPPACSSCDGDRVVAIMKKFFPALIIEEVPYDSIAGKELMSEFSIRVLPAFIFNESIAAARNFGQLQSSFIMNGGNYILKKNVANSNFHSDRPERLGRMDIFLMNRQPVSIIATENLKEFQDAFLDVNVAFHTENDGLTKELGINTFPTILINNRMEVDGVQSADSLREYYCSMNDDDACAETLRKGLVTTGN